jgi:serine/threonine protein kinase
MEFVSGRTLDKALSEGRLSVSRAMKITDQIAEALDYAHKQGIVHGDLNPRNVIIADDDRVVLGDFIGLSPEESDVKGVFGVPEYLSPEQARGMGATPRSDTYSLGIILYEMLTGRPPFSEPEPGDTLFRQISSDPEPPSKLNKSIPPRLEKLLLRMLLKNPDARPASCKAVSDELLVVRNELESGKPGSRRSVRWGAHPLLVVMLLLALGGIGGVGYLVQRSMVADREFAEIASDSSALPALTAARALEQSAIARYNEEIRRGQNLLSHEQYREAAKAFHRACKLQPRKADPHIFLAAVFIERQDFALAKFELKAALKLDPDNKEAEATLSYVTTKLPREEE